MAGPGTAAVAQLRPSMQSASTDIVNDDAESFRAPYWQCMLAGGVGGSSGDMLMHSIDTVKTRQQGDRAIPARYPSLRSAYATIFRQEGFGRGLYSGVTPAFLGSFPGTVIFFGTYELTKRNLIDAGLHPSLAYLSGGFLADLAASVVYVPSEVLKTRLQLQGRFNNPYTDAGYNYRGTWDAARTIVRQEGASALFYGYRATIWRDLPFSALQFAFYEQAQTWAKQYVGGNRDIGLGLEIATATSAGGLAGVITCPLDVVKTRTQTQSNTEIEPASQPPSNKASAARGSTKSSSTSTSRSALRLPFVLQAARRQITSSSAHPPLTKTNASAARLDTSSVLGGLKKMYQLEGMAGLFRGVGPRAIWTSVQSGTMLVLYQIILKNMASNPWFANEGNAAH